MGLGLYRVEGAKLCWHFLQTKHYNSDRPKLYFKIIEVGAASYEAVTFDHERCESEWNVYRKNLARVGNLGL